MNHIQHSPPAEDEALQALKALEILLPKDAAAEDRLTRIEAEVAKCRKSRNKFQRKIAYYRAIMAPIRRIPIEVLAIIFRFLVSSTGPGAILKIGHVCRMWRDAALFPGLWSNIIVDAETGFSLQRALLYLQRSGNSSLEISYIQSFPSHWLWSTWSAVKSYAHRWNTLSLTLDDCEIASRELQSLPIAPNLTELSVTIRGECADPDDDGWFGFEPPHPDASYSETLAGSPLLKGLHFSTFILPMPGPLFLNITKLDITDTFSQLKNRRHDLTPIQPDALLRLLEFCINLQEFAFDAEASVSWFVRMKTWPDVQGPTVALPHLRHLHLNCHFVFAGLLFDFLDVPRLNTASLRMRPRHETAESKGFESVALRFLCRCPELRSLRVHAYSDIGIVAAMMTGLCHLETLHLEYTPNPDFTIKSLIDHDQFEFFDEPVWLVPKLTSVTVDAQPFQLVHDSMGMFVKSRYCHNMLNAAPRCIQKLVVNGQDMLLGVPSGEIAEFERTERFGGLTWEMHQRGVRQVLANDALQLMHKTFSGTEYDLGTIRELRQQ